MKTRSTLIEPCMAIGKTDDIFKYFCKNNLFENSAENVSVKWKMLSCFQICQRSTYKLRDLFLVLRRSAQVPASQIPINKKDIYFYRFLLLLKAEYKSKVY